VCGYKQVPMQASAWLPPLDYETDGLEAGLPQQAAVAISAKGKK
jgi:hypothetical protein